jgi:dienelactone hydrolase
MGPFRQFAALVALGICAVSQCVLAETPATSLSDGRIGRIPFSVAAGKSSMASLVNGTYVVSDTIWGDLLMPGGVAGVVPAIVISHGSGGIDSLSYEWADLFAGMGIATFVIDHFNGRGYPDTYSDQSRLESSVIAADGLMALRLLATHPRIDPKRIGYIGFSKGGYGALLSAYERLRSAILPDSTRFALHLPFYPATFTTADRLTGAPIRIFKGDLDDYDTVESTRALADHLREVGGDVQLIVYPGAYHAFDATYPPVWLADAQTTKYCLFSTNIDTLITVDTRTGAAITNLGAYINGCFTLGVRIGNSEPARTQSRQAVWSVVRQQFGLTGIPETITPLFANSVNHTALWWNPSESGWGLNLNQQDGILFGTLFTYDATRAPMWLVMSSGFRWGTSSTYSGDLYRTNGSPFNANPFLSLKPEDLTKVGTMMVSISGVNDALLNYSVDGVSVSKAIRKQVFGARAANCVMTSESRATATNYQDLWWNAAESGWGMNITHQDDILFATLFTYDSSGKDLWLVMSAGRRQSDGSYLGDLYRTSGPAFDTVPFAGVSVATVGTMRLRFSDGNNGTLTYTYNNVSVTKAITRQLFSSPVPACS